MRENELHEDQQSLWMVIASPMIWAAHFLLCYATASILCGRFGSSSVAVGNLRELIGAYTAVAMVGVAVVAWKNRHGFDWAALPHDFDTPQDRHRFLGFATVLLSGLSAAAILYAALTIIFVPGCR